MIQLTRLNGSLMVVNSDLIKYAEASPDTMLTLINGEKIMVLETCEQVVERTVAYRTRLLTEVAQRWSVDLATSGALASGAAGTRAANAARASRLQADEIETNEETAQLRRRPE